MLPAIPAKPEYSIEKHNNKSQKYNVWQQYPNSMCNISNNIDKRSDYIAKKIEHRIEILPPLRRLRVGPPQQLTMTNAI